MSNPHKFDPNRRGLCKFTTRNGMCHLPKDAPVHKRYEDKIASCEESSQFSVTSHIPCGAPAEAIVWHNNDRRAYTMCGPCSYHNEKNRRAIVLRRK